MATYRLTLHQTYWMQGMFNVIRDYDRFIQASDGPIWIQLGKEGPLVEASVNRRSANQNGTARVHLGKAGSQWLRSTFEIGDVLLVHFQARDRLMLEPA